MENVENLTTDEYVHYVNMWHLKNRARFYNKWNVFMKLKRWPYK